MTRHFNLIDEPWLPVEGVGDVSLRRIFTDPTLTFLSGSPVMKIAGFNLLLAVVQSAIPLASEEERQNLSTEEMAKRTLLYLEERHDKFDLYGEQPFLQVPGAVKAGLLPYRAFSPELCSGNNAVLRSGQILHAPDDALKARLILLQQGFAVGGKRIDTKTKLSAGCTKKKSAVPGSSLGSYGYLHTFVLKDTLWESLKLNLFSAEDLADFRHFPEGLGVAPWDAPLIGEECENAKRLSSSLMGRLVPMSRLCLLAEGGMHCTEGVRHLGWKEGTVDPSAAINLSKKTPQTLWVNPERRPWRTLPALLQFLSAATPAGNGFVCSRLRMGLKRAKDDGLIRIWSSGLCISFSSGEQIMKSANDYVESVVDVEFNGKADTWFERYAKTMDAVEKLSRTLFKCIAGYYRELKVKDSPLPGQAVNTFWQAAESYSSELIAACEGEDKEEIRKVKTKILRLAEKTYNDSCPSQTPRQITAWVNNQMDTRFYMKTDKDSKAK